MIFVFFGFVFMLAGIMMKVRFHKLKNIPPEPPKRSENDLKLTLTIYKNLPHGKNSSGLNTNELFIKYYFPTKEYTTEIHRRLETDLLSLLNATYSIKPASSTWPNATFAQVEHLIGPVFTAAKNEYNLPF